MPHGAVALTDTRGRDALRAARWRQANSHKVRAQKRRWYRRYRARIKAKSNLYYWKNRERIRADRKQSRQNQWPKVTPQELDACRKDSRLAKTIRGSSFIVCLECGVVLQTLTRHIGQCTA